MCNQTKCKYFLLVHVLVLYNGDNMHALWWWTNNSCGECPWAWIQLPVVAHTKYLWSRTHVKAGSHLFCLRRVATGSVCKMIWTRVRYAEILGIPAYASRRASKSFHMHFRSQRDASKRIHAICVGVEFQTVSYICVCHANGFYLVGYKIHSWWRELLL